MSMPLSRFQRRAIVIFSLLALLAVLAARIAGPPDVDDKNQPMTMAYTVDMIEHGRWILPRDADGNYTTKPLLYNWLAVPAVWIGGSESEFAHKLPSVLSLIAGFALLVLLGQRIDPSGALGWMTGLFFVTNYTIFQLGYLARTDMLLTFWLLLGWVIATALIARPDAGNRLALQLAFWLCVALAWLTKGPPALVLVIYALVAPRCITGRWRDAAMFGWSWGLPLSMLPFAAWVAGVWSIAPDHLLGQLWGEEVYGRVTGLGEEGNREGPIEFFYRLFHMPLYYLQRFVPWSLLSILAMVEIWRRTDDRRRAWRGMDQPTGLWLHAAAIMVLVILGFFTLSTGKRAAYIAAAYGPGSMLAAWWVLAVGLRLMPRILWLVFPVAALVIMVMIPQRW